MITKKMRPWVDRIKEVGNDANPELDPIGESEAMDVAGFTFQLSKVSYELDTLVNLSSKADDWICIDHERRPPAVRPHG